MAETSWMNGLWSGIGDGVQAIGGVATSAINAKATKNALNQQAYLNEQEYAFGSSMLQLNSAAFTQRAIVITIAVVVLVAIAAVALVIYKKA